jgi:hypothetical protein
MIVFFIIAFIQKTQKVLLNHFRNIFQVKNLQNHSINKLSEALIHPKAMLNPSVALMERIDSILIIPMSSKH